jgi:hypothetical protein
MEAPSLWNSQHQKRSRKFVPAKIETVNFMSGILPWATPEHLLAHRYGPPALIDVRDGVNLGLCRALG